MMERRPLPAPGAVKQFLRVAEIACGGMGHVDLCLRVEGEFRRFYAVKRLHPQYRADPSFRAMFVDEGRLAGLVRHPNVVSVLDVGEDEDGPYLVMEYVDGLSIAAIVVSAAAQNELLPVPFCLRICADAARGLDAAHELRDIDGTPLGLVHRDVSAQNILVGFDGVVRVGDFGIAKALGNSARTAVGVLKGNVGYMSPEQLQFAALDRRSDLFSLGVVLYELLASTRLYSAEDGTQLARRILTEPPPDIAEAREDVPNDVTELIFQLLAKDPADRPRSAREVADCLESVLVTLAVEEHGFDFRGYLLERFGATGEEQRRRLESLAAETRATTSQKSAPARGSRSAPRARPRRRALGAGVALAVVVAGAGLALKLGGEGPPAAEPRASRTVWSGDYHVCADDGSQLWCWGKNNEGQLGVGSTSDRTVKAQLKVPWRPRALAGGRFHTCAVAETGQAFCWGQNQFGQLGDGSDRPARRPVEVRGPAELVAIAAGRAHSCGITRNGRVLCWGDNTVGQLGDGTREARPRAAEVAGLARADEVAARGDATCARDGGTVHCWGALRRDRGPNRRAETVPPEGVAAPQRIPRMDDAAQLVVGDNIVCVRRVDGRVACWGDNRHGQLGDGGTTSRDEPADVRGIDDAVSIAAGPFHACAVRRSGRLLCWGRNQWGNLGDGSREDRPLPQEAADVQDFVSVAAGTVHTCGVRRNGAVLCWGHNDSGQIGDGTSGTDRDRPVSVAGLL